MVFRRVGERIATVMLLLVVTLGVVPAAVWAEDPVPPASEPAVIVEDTPADSSADPGEGAPEEESAPDQPAEQPAAPAPETEATPAEEPAEPDPTAEEAALEEAASTAPAAEVRAYVQSSGWARSWAKDGQTAGTVGKSKRVEALRMRVVGGGEEVPAGGIEYRAHVQSEGWQGWVADGATSGSTGKSRRLEALQVRLTGELAEQFDVWYRVHVQGIGWMAWAKNGETAGTAGMARRVEAVQVTILPKGSEAPATTDQATDAAFQGAETVSVVAHVQKQGWMKAVTGGKTAGSVGKGRRLEALRVSLTGVPMPGGVETRAHVQGVGWQGWRADGKVAGTTGQGKRVEALCMRLTGEAAEAYDIYYRVHVQGLGWLAWAKNGEVAGSEGLSLRIEAVQVRLVAKGAKAPSNPSDNYPLACVEHLSLSYDGYVQGTGWQGWRQEGKTAGTTDQSLRLEGIRVQMGEDAAGTGITYRTYLQSTGWQGWCTGDSIAGIPDGEKRVETVQIKLTGQMANVYSVWYRVYVEGLGWMGWARDGGSAGTQNVARRIEAIQIKLVPKNAKAPGSTRGAFIGDPKSGLKAANGSRALTSFGGYTPSARVRNNIQAQINALRSRGYDVGFIMMDLRTYQGISYNCDALFYAASSIKAPYIFAVLNQNPGVVNTRAYDIQQTLFYSSDAHYKALVATYGVGPMMAWNNACGARSSIYRSIPWVECSARDMALMWAHAYPRFNSSQAWRTLAVWCQRPNVSTIHATLSSKYPTRTKAGWIASGGPRSARINGGGPYWDVSDDAGIVYALNGPYVIAIMSSVPANHDALNGLVSAIDAAHREM